MVSDGENYSRQVEKMQRDGFGIDSKEKIPLGYSLIMLSRSYPEHLRSHMYTAIYFTASSLSIYELFYILSVKSLGNRTQKAESSEKLWHA